MKYLEELEPGDCCQIQQALFIVTSDFRKNGSRLLINLVNGSSRWYQGNTVCDASPIFTLDSENNSFSPVKECKKNENHIY